MSAFKSGLFLKDDGGFPLTLMRPLVYQSDLLQRKVTVPAKFKTDLASIPRVLWNILPPIGSYGRAAVVHDLLYQQGGCTRGEADGVLNEAMQVLKVGDWTRRTIYAGVRLGGWKVWRQYRKAHV